jgi:tellurite resistance protein
VFASWLITLWISGDRPVDAVHGGYFLPTVAAGFVGASAAQAAGWSGVATGAFAVGMLFWVIVQTVLLVRLAVRPPLPDPLQPTLAIMVAPPAVGGLAWFAIQDGQIDTLQHGLTGATVLLLLVQIFLLPRYRRLSFSLGFWSFTFPFAAVGAYTVTWIGHAPHPVAVSVTVLVLAATTTLITGIGARTLRDARRPQATRDEAVLAAADAEAIH